MVRPTREYFGGILGGVGLSLVIGAGFAGWHPALVIPGFALIGAGSFLARSAQRCRTGMANAGVDA